MVGPFRRELNCLASFLSSRYRMRGVCSVHVLFLHMAKRPNGRLAQVLGTPVKFPSDSRANAIPWHRSSSSQKALWCRGALRVGGVRWAVEVSLGLSLKLLFCNPFSNLPKPDLLQPSLPQPGHQHLLHCALRLGSFGTSWITCTSLIPWATSCSPKTADCFTCKCVEFPFSTLFQATLSGGLGVWASGSCRGFRGNPF